MMLLNSIGKFSTHFHILKGFSQIHKKKSICDNNWEFREMRGSKKGVSACLSLFCHFFHLFHLNSFSDFLFIIVYIVMAICVPLGILSMICETNLHQNLFFDSFLSWVSVSYREKNIRRYMEPLWYKNPLKISYVVKCERLTWKYFV